MSQLIRALFLDVGGVLMTNGWDHALRKKTAEHFGIEYDEMNDRHQLIFDTYETGKLTFEEYLEQIIFYKKRGFSEQTVIDYIFDAVRPFQDMINYVKDIKNQHHLKIGVVSNEGRELAVDRINRFNLHEFVDFFIVSSFVRFRKPDPDIYKLAIDIAQVDPSQIIYIDDRELLIEAGRELGMKAIHHKDVDSTRMAVNMIMES